jgi:hypothetical protein
LARAAARSGGTLTLRRRHDLRVIGGAPLSLVVQGAYTAGAPALQLRCPGGRLTGTVPAALPLTAGGATVAVQTSALDEAGLITLAVLPGLSALADGAAVTLGELEHAFPAVRESETLEGAGNPTVPASVDAWMLPARGTPWAPELGDEAVDRGRRVVERAELGTGAVAGWKVVLA